MNEGSDNSTIDERTAEQNALASDPYEPPNGTVVDGRFKIIGLIGRNDQFIFYDAEHLMLQKRVVIKMPVGASGIAAEQPPVCALVDYSETLSPVEIKKQFGLDNLSSEFEAFVMSRRARRRTVLDEAASSGAAKLVLSVGLPATIFLSVCAAAFVFSDYDTARPRFELAVANANPFATTGTRIKALIHLSDALAVKKNSQQALTVLQDASRLADNSNDSILRADVTMATAELVIPNDRAHAMDLYHSAGTIYANRGDQLFKMRRYEQATVLYDRAVEALTNESVLAWPRADDRRAQAPPQDVVHRPYVIADFLGKILATYPIAKRPDLVRALFNRYFEIATTAAENCGNKCFPRDLRDDMTLALAVADNRSGLSEEAIEIVKQQIAIDRNHQVYTRLPQLYACLASSQLTAGHKQEAIQNTELAGDYVHLWAPAWCAQQFHFIDSLEQNLVRFAPASNVLPVIQREINLLTSYWPQTSALCAFPPDEKTRARTKMRLYSDLAWANTELKHAGEAEKNLLAAKQLADMSDPESVSVLATTLIREAAYAQLLLHDNARAVQHLKKALSLTSEKRPSDRNIILVCLMQLAVFAQMAGDDASAAQYYRRTLELWPTQPGTRDEGLQNVVAAFCVVLQRSGQDAEAKKIQERYKPFAPRT